MCFREIQIYLFIARTSSGGDRDQNKEAVESSSLFSFSGSKGKGLTALQTEANCLPAKLVITFRYRLRIAFRPCQGISMR